MTEIVFFLLLARTESPTRFFAVLNQTKHRPSQIEEISEMIYYQSDNKCQSFFIATIYQSMIQHFDGNDTFFVARMVPDR